MRGGGGYFAPLVVVVALVVVALILAVGAGVIAIPITLISGAANYPSRQATQQAHETNADKITANGVEIKVGSTWTGRLVPCNNGYQADRSCGTKLIITQLHPDGTFDGKWENEYLAGKPGEGYDENAATVTGTIDVSTGSIQFHGTGRLSGSIACCDSYVGTINSDRSITGHVDYEGGGKFSLQQS